jgi:hypothetical protein
METPRCLLAGHVKWAAEVLIKGKAVPLYAMEALGEEEA